MRPTGTMNRIKLEQQRRDQAKQGTDAMRAAVQGVMELTKKLEELERRMFAIAVTQDVLIGLSGLGEQVKAEVTNRAKAYTQVQEAAGVAPGR